MVPMAESWPQFRPVWVLSWAAAIGRVWLFGSGEGRRESVVVPGEDQAEYGRRHYAGRYQRQGDAVESLEPGGAVHHRGLFQRWRQIQEESVHDPDRKRQIERQVGDDEARYGVEQVYVTEEDEERNTIAAIGAMRVEMIQNATCCLPRNWLLASP